jgi:acyl carrier protein
MVYLSKKVKTMEERLKDVFATVLEIDRSIIDESLSTKTLPEWDSLRHMNLIIAIEEEFGISIEDEAIANLTTYVALRDYLKISV